MSRQQKREPLSSYFPELRLIAPDAPTPVLEHVIRETIIDFCDYTKYWRETLYPTKASASGGQQDVILLKNVELVEIFSATAIISGEQVPVVRVDPEYDDLEEFEVSEKPYYYQQSNEYIVFGPSAVIGGIKVEMTAAMKPTRTAPDAAKSIYQDYFSTILHGAKKRLFEMPKKDWSTPELVGYHEAHYMQGRDDAMRKSYRGFKSFRPVTPRKRNHF